MNLIEHTAGPFRWYETLSEEYAVTDLNCRSLLNGKKESEGNAQLLSLANTAPHSCTVPDCPGPENLRKLETFDGLLEAAEEALVAIRDTGIIFQQTPAGNSTKAACIAIRRLEGMLSVAISDAKAEGSPPYERSNASDTL